MNISNTEPTCENCGKPLFGRTDKKFCNDSCRNEFNRKKRTAQQIAEYEKLPEIFKIIRRNHAILKTYQLEQTEPGAMISVNRSELLHRGYHFKFFTSLHRDSTGQLWKFCFDYGIKEEPYSETGYHCLICYRLAQIDTNNPDTLIIPNN